MKQPSSHKTIEPTQPGLKLKLDWLDKLRTLLQTWAFCLTVSALQQAFQSDRPYELPLVYSLCIGSFTWALIDLGRELFPSARETGWPQGLGGIVLPFAGIVGGYFLGTLAGDFWFGWSSWDAHPAARSQLPVSIIVTGVAGIAGTYYFYSKNKAQFLQSKVQETAKQAAESKLKLLEAQIEPHMLFNTLANLRALIATEPDRALTMLDHLNSYLRATLHGSQGSSHPLQTEFERLRDYLELMAVRMGPRLRYKLDLPAELANLPVAPLLLQPLVENAIQHGLEPSVQGGSIVVRACREGGFMKLEVQDTGVGTATNSAKASKSGGFGLAQVRERLQTLFGPQGTLVLAANSSAGMLATVRYPLL